MNEDLNFEVRVTTSEISKKLNISVSKVRTFKVKLKKVFIF